MRVVVINCVTLNGGDAAILFALREVLYQAFGKDIELLVFDSQAVVAERYHKDFCFRQMYRPLPSAWVRKARLGFLWKAALNLRWRIGCSLMSFGFRRLGLFVSPSGVRTHHEAYAGADLIVGTGGTYLVEHYDLAYRTLHLLTAACHKAPIALFTQSLGPFKSSRAKRLIRQILGVTDVLLLRDQLSLHHIEEHKAPKTVTCVLPDSAFILKACITPNQHRTPPSQRPLRVAISVRRWDHFNGVPPKIGMQQYCAAITEVVTHLVRKQSARVTFLSTCQGIPEYWTDDSKLATKIARELPSDVTEHVSVQGGFHTPFELIAQFSTFDFVIATRMHAAILSMVSGTPVLAIAYEFKTRKLFEGLGYKEWVLDIERLDDHTIVSKIDAFLSTLPALQNDLERKVAACHEAATRSVSMMRNAVTTAE